MSFYVLAVVIMCNLLIALIVVRQKIRIVSDDTNGPLCVCLRVFVFKFEIQYIFHSKYFIL